MARNESKFVLVDDEQMVASPQDVLGAVQAGGFAGASAAFGYSESHLRAFLKRNGVVSRRTYEQVPQVPVPGGEPDLPF